MAQALRSINTSALSHSHRARRNKHSPPPHSPRNGEGTRVGTNQGRIRVCIMCLLHMFNRPKTEDPGRILDVSCDRSTCYNPVLQPCVLDYAVSISTSFNIDTGKGSRVVSTRISDPSFMLTKYVREEGVTSHECNV